MLHPLQRKGSAKEKPLQSVVIDRLSVCVDFPHTNKQRSECSDHRAESFH